MTEHLRITADRLLEFVLPYPGEKSWDEIKTYLDVTDISLHKIISEIELMIPHLLYRSTSVEGESLAVGVKEEMKPGQLYFLSEGGFTTGHSFYREP